MANKGKKKKSSRYQQRKKILKDLYKQGVFDRDYPKRPRAEATPAGWAILNSNSTFARSYKSPFPLWWDSKEKADKAHRAGYGDSLARVVEVILKPANPGHNGYVVAGIKGRY